MAEINRKEMLCVLAEKVMGWSLRHIEFRGVARVIADVRDEDGSVYHLRVWGDGGTSPWWSPLTCINDAWKLVEALREKGWIVKLESRMTGWWIQLHLHRPGNCAIFKAEHSSLPYAICQASHEAARFLPAPHTQESAEK